MLFSSKAGTTLHLWTVFFVWIMIAGVFAVLANVLAAEYL